MKQFALHEIDPEVLMYDDISFIRNNSVTFVYRDTLPEILEVLVDMFNMDHLSDQNYLIIIDNHSNEIIYK